MKEQGKQYSLHYNNIIELSNAYNQLLMFYKNHDKKVIERLVYYGINYKQL